MSLHAQLNAVRVLFGQLITRDERPCRHATWSMPDKTKNWILLIRCVRKGAFNISRQTSSLGSPYVTRSHGRNSQPAPRFLLLPGTRVLAIALPAVISKATEPHLVLQCAGNMWDVRFSCFVKLLSLPRVINFKFLLRLTRNITSHSMKNLVFHNTYWDNRWLYYQFSLHHLYISL